MTSPDQLAAFAAFQTQQTAVTSSGLPPVQKGRALSVLVHSDTKVGKSTFGHTTNPPRLLIDAEMAYRFMPGPKVFWDPLTQAPPEAPVNGNWETCVVIVHTYQHMTKALEWLNTGKHPFRSVTVDSLSEIQTKLRDDLTETGRMSQQLWGDILIQMEKVCRQFRDLTENPVRPIEAVILTAMTQMKDGKWRPYLQGQSQTKAPYYFDICGYLYVQELQTDPNDASSPRYKVRQMLVIPHPMFEAGERVQGRLGDVVTNPTIPTMLDAVFGPQTTN